MKKLKLILLIALIFVAGFAAGIVTTRLVVRHFVLRAIAQPELVRAMIQRDLTRQLRLDAGQRGKVGEILSGTQTRIRALRRQFQPEFAVIMHDTENEISAVLTPAQQEKFERYCAQRERIWRAK